VFSPLGYATILSILGQGAMGPTRDEIYQVLQQPDNNEEGEISRLFSVSSFNLIR
jgi:hypothetical protein